MRFRAAKCKFVIRLKPKVEKTLQCFINWASVFNEKQGASRITAFLRRIDELIVTKLVDRIITLLFIVIIQKFNFHLSDLKNKTMTNNGIVIFLRWLESEPLIKLPRGY